MAYCWYLTLNIKCDSHTEWPEFQQGITQDYFPLYNVAVHTCTYSFILCMLIEIPEEAVLKQSD